LSLKSTSPNSGHPYFPGIDLIEPVYSLGFVAERLEHGGIALALPLFDLTTRRWLDCAVLPSFSPEAIVERLERAIRTFGLPQTLLLCDAHEFPVAPIVAWGRERGINVFWAGTGAWINLPLLPVPSGASWRSVGEAGETLDAWRVEYDELSYPFGASPRSHRDVGSFAGPSRHFS
jgi:hypothetical protein